jgi:serine/threonine-protein kinase
MGTNATRDTVVKTGDVVEGRYRIIKTLGEGGMGTVFLAEHTLIKRRVAIKILHSELATDADVIERFMNEARAAGTLGHPNIVESTDMGFTASHVPYIVFEYLEGTLLTDEVYRVGGLPVRRAVRIAQQIASALHAAHNASIVHRDLKSDNVFLTDKDDALDHVKVLDFGISRFLETEDEATRRGMVMGTPEFMAPEQITAPDSVDKRADIYALGVILYEMLTARRPFSGEDDPRALMHRIVNNPPPPLQRPEVPHGMAEMIMNKLLAKDPAQRFQSMMDVEAALDAFVTSDGVRGMRRTRMSMQVPVVTIDDVARHSDLIPRPVNAKSSLDTPWPPATLGGPIQQVVALPAVPPAKKPWALYGVAAFGLLAGGAGLMFGLKSGGGEQVANNLPAPVVQPQPAAATTPAPREPVAPAKVQVELNANVPNARVTFRRRVAAAPSTMSITPSDIIELVEVSAPGYKTVRYWLTFDRPTTLNARLVKGNGLVEASEEQTLIALGELAAPETPAIAAAATKATTAVVAPKVEKTEKVATVAKPEPPAAPAVAAATETKPETAKAAVPTPRKIGRGGAADELAAKAETAVPATDVPDAGEPVKPLDPTKTEPTAEPKADPIAKVEPKEEAAVAKPSIDYSTINSVVSKNRPEILKCYAEGAKKTPGLKGTLSLQLQVEPSGKVRAQVQSTLNAPLVAACVIRAANSWKFPARAGSSEIANVTYPFKFGS